MDGLAAPEGAAGVLASVAVPEGAAGLLAESGPSCSGVVAVSAPPRTI